MPRIGIVRRKKTGAGPFAAIAAFIIICGLVLLVGSAGDCSAGGSTDRELLGQRITSALQQTQAADEALEKGNFGNARGFVQQARQELTAALGQLQGKPAESGR